MRKVYKKMFLPNGTVKIYGSNRWLMIRYAKPEWSDNKEQYVIFEGRRFYISEFMRLNYGNAYVPDYLKEFDGSAGCTNTSSYLIKMDETGEAAKIFLIG